MNLKIAPINHDVTIEKLKRTITGLKARNTTLENQLNKKLTDFIDFYRELSEEEPHAPVMDVNFIVKEFNKNNK